MSSDPRAALARQLKLHLESLRAAGVEFIPLAASVPLRVAAKQGVPIAPADSPASIMVPTTTGLFAAPEAAAADSPEQRRHELTVLAESITGCDRCPELFATRTQTVFGVGKIDPDICFVGEAPGADEDRLGEPFVGRAGQLLNTIIEKGLGYRREDVYICNTIKCRPPNNRTPSPEERDNCRDYFDRQLELVRPRSIVCLGATAAKNVLGTTLGIGKLRGRVHKYKNIPVVCTYHPSAILREEPAQTFRRACWEDMKLLLREMGRPIPGAR